MSCKGVIASLLLLPALLLLGCAETIHVGSSGLLFLDQNEASQWREAQPRDMWRVPVGSTLVEDMNLLSSAMLLVGLKNYDQEMSNGDYLLLDTSTGTVQWRYKRSKIGDYSVLDAGDDRIVFRVDEAGKVSLVALDSRTGRRVWSVVSKKDFVQIVVLYEADTIAVAEGGGQSGTVTGYDRSSGEKLWKRELGLDREFNRDTAVLTERDRLWYVGSGVECLDGRTGKTLWSRSDVNPNGAGPNPQLGDGVVALIDRQNRLTLLDAQTGNTRWSTPMTDNERVSSVFAGERRVYLRSKTRIPRREPYKLSAVSLSDGAILWDSWSATQTLSNILEEDGSIYVATGTSVLFLDAKTGEMRREMPASMIGGRYPVKIRRIDGGIVYLGELTIAAFDASTGKRSYQHTVEPISQLTTVDAVKSYMKKVEAQLRQGSAGSGPVYLPTNTYQRYQDLANHYQKRYQFYSRQPGGSSRANVARIQSEMNSVWARQAATRDFCNSIENLGTAMEADQRQAYLQADRATLRRLTLIYRSLMGAYGMAESAEFAYRPHRENGVTGVLLTHLSSGNSRFQPLSPTYEEYGLWAAVDLDRGVIYHHGMRREGGAGQQDTGPLTTHLIASEIDIPQGR